MTRFAAMVLLFASGPLLAAKSDPVLPPGKLDPATFPNQAALIRGEMVKGGRYEFVTDEERATVESSLEEMARKLGGHATLAELPRADQAALTKAEEQVNEILAKRDRNRVICERRKTMGSHFPQEVCETYGERMARTGETH